MATRFHLLSESLFFQQLLPGGEDPTEAEQEMFKPADLSKAMTERDIYPQLGQTAASVFKAAGCTRLRFLITSNHKAKDGNNADTDTINDGGVYLSNRLADAATTLTEAAQKKSKAAEKVTPMAEYGNRSWHYQVVPVEVKYNINKAAFYFDDHDFSRSTSPEGKDKRSGAKKRSPDHHTSQDVEASAPLNEGTTASSTGPMTPSVQQSQAVDSQTANDPDVTVRSMQVPPFIRNSLGGSQALGQIGEYMLNTLTYQHRLFSFSIYIAKEKCRLLFFDRTGAFVSTPFDWTVTSSSLHRFLWRLAHMKEYDPKMGFDPTVTLATKDERQRFIKMATNPDVCKRVQEYVTKATAHSCPIYKLEVVMTPPTPEENLPDVPVQAGSAVSSDSPQEEHESPKVYHFLVGRPHFSTDSLIGRCTRGYVALRVDVEPGEKEQVCFVKDCWRAYVPGRTRPEHLIYQRLHKHQVPNIATLICGGDVGGPGQQKTYVQNYLSMHDPRMQPVPRLHYRLVTAEVGIPLTQFPNFTELAYIFIDALTAHWAAWTRAGVLHRDISIGNIMIHPTTGRGFLIDWDLSRLNVELGNGPTEPDRSGTWPTRSVLFLKYPRKPYRPSDDIESFVHGFRYLTARYHPTNIFDPKTWATNTYQEVSLVNGVLVGGITKLDHFNSPSTFKVQDNTELQAVLDALAKGCHSFYQLVDHHVMEEMYGMGKKKVADAIDEPGPRRDDLQLPEEFAEMMASTNQGHSTDDHPSHAIPASSSPIPSPPSDPCEIRGFLSSHRDVIMALCLMQSRTKDKRPDQFALPSRRLFQAAAHSRTNDLGTYSTSGTVESRPRISLTSARAGSYTADLQSASTPPPIDPDMAGSGSFVNYQPSASGSKKRPLQEDANPQQATSADPFGGGPLPESGSTSSKAKKKRTTMTCE